MFINLKNSYEVSFLMSFERSDSFIVVKAEINIHKKLETVNFGKSCFEVFTVYVCMSPLHSFIASTETCNSNYKIQHYDSCCLILWENSMLNATVVP